MPVKDIDVQGVKNSKEGSSVAAGPHSLQMAFDTASIEALLQEIAAVLQRPLPPGPGLSAPPSISLPVRCTEGHGCSSCSGIDQTSAPDGDWYWAQRSDQNASTSSQACNDCRPDERDYFSSNRPRSEVDLHGGFSKSVHMHDQGSSASSTSSPVSLAEGQHTRGQTSEERVPANSGSEQSSVGTKQLPDDTKQHAGNTETCQASWCDGELSAAAMNLQDVSLLSSPLWWENPLALDSTVSASLKLCQTELKRLSSANLPVQLSQQCSDPVQDSSSQLPSVQQHAASSGPHPPAACLAAKADHQACPLQSGAVYSSLLEEVHFDPEASAGRHPNSAAGELSCPACIACSPQPSSPHSLQTGRPSNQLQSEEQPANMILSSSQHSPQVQTLPQPAFVFRSASDVPIANAQIFGAPLQANQEVQETCGRQIFMDIANRLPDARLGNAACHAVKAYSSNDTRHLKSPAAASLHASASNRPGQGDLKLQVSHHATMHKSTNFIDCTSAQRNI